MAIPSVVDSRQRPRVLIAGLKTKGKPAAEGTMSMGGSRYWALNFKVGIFKSCGGESWAFIAVFPSGRDGDLQRAQRPDQYELPRPMEELVGRCDLEGILVNFVDRSSVA